MLLQFLFGGLVVLAAPALAADPPCQLLGPNFPAPVSLSSSAAFKKAISDFEAKLANITGDASANAWSVSISSAASNETLYEHHFTPDSVKNATHGVKKIDGDSVYRVGSISKVFTVYTFLAGLGDAHFNDPITKYVPELKNAKKLPNPKDAIYDDINNVNWDEITLGNLASQLSGIERDTFAGDLSIVLPQETLKAAGLPILNGSNVPTCGALPRQRLCNRTDLFTGLQQAHPSFPTSHSPAYSNVAFSILAYAFENLSGKKDFGKAMEDLIFKPLGMKGASYTVPKSDANAVIPGGNATLTWWDVDIGISAPAGSVYASTNDMIAFCRSILSSSILPKALTRRWLKPLTTTVDENMLVGAPWEIRRFPLPNGHSTVLYAMNGDVGTYDTAMVLSPDHQLAITVMASGPSSSALRTSLTAALVNVVVPAADDGAKGEAKDHYAGTYRDASTNSSITIAADNEAGLQVSELISRGVSSLDALGEALGLPGTLQPRIHPTTLQTLSEKAGGSGTYASRTGWRLVYLPRDTSIAAEDKYSGACQAWVSVNAPMLGGAGVDDVVFSLSDGGEATGVEMRGFRLQLKKLN